MVETAECLFEGQCVGEGALTLQIVCRWVSGIFRGRQLPVSLICVKCSAIWEGGREGGRGRGGAQEDMTSLVNTSLISQK